MLNPGEIVVDSFAGGGGASLGISWALGRGPDVAINHDREAIALHKANHPESEHYAEDVFEVDPVKACKGRPVGLLWASPDCKHFSKAKGGKPVSPRVRGLAWVVVRWAAEVRPRMIALENVEEFQTWCPVLDNGMPCQKRKGETFAAWRACLTTGLRRGHPAWREIRDVLGQDWPHYDRLVEGLGYDFSARELRACDYGTPTIRKRLFVVMRCDGAPITWPSPTHAAPEKVAGQLEMGRPPELRLWRTAAECIDWSIPCPSIFERKRPLAENTLRRIARGIKRFVIDNPKPFIVPATHGENAGGPDKRTHGIDEPLRSIITRGAPFHLVAPVIAPLTHHAGHSATLHDRGQSCEDPMATVTGAHRGEQALISPYLARIGQTGGNGAYVNEAREPVTTITSKAEHLLVTPTLIQTGYGEREGQAPRAPGLDKPLGTVVAGGAKHALVSAFMAKHYGGNETPGAAVVDPAPTITAKDHNAVVSAVLQENDDCGEGEVPAFAGMTGQGKPEITASHILKLKGTSRDGQATDTPLHTVQAGGLHYAEVRAFLVAYFGNEKDGAALDDPMRTVTSRDRFGLVTVEGHEYVIVDIGMRMLVPRELYRAQGFPDSYRIEIEFNGKPLTKTAQVRMCGNSVCPPLAEAIIRANFARDNFEEKGRALAVA